MADNMFKLKIDPVKSQEITLKPNKSSFPFHLMLGHHVLAKMVSIYFSNIIIQTKHI